MRSPSSMNVSVVITNPARSDDADEQSPFSAVDPDDLVFAVFFREEEQRSAFLTQIKTVAGTLVDAGSDPDSAAMSLADEYRVLHAEGNGCEAMECVIKWRAGLMHQGFHVYRLKVGYPPYRTSCIISFRELDTPSIRRNLDCALHHLELEKSRMLGFFGMDGFIERN